MQKIVRYLMIQPKDRGDRLCVVDFPRQNHTNRRGQRDQALENHFVGFRLCFSCAKPGGQKYRHGFSYKSRAGIKIEDQPPLAGGVAGLLEQLALGGGQGLFAGIDASGGQFPEKIIRGVSILALQKDSRRRTRFINRENDDRSRVMDNIAAGADAAGLLHFVRGHPEDRTTIHGSRRNNSSLLMRSLSGLDWLRRVRWLCHLNNIKHVMLDRLLGWG